MIEIKNLGYDYGDQVALDNVSFNMGKGTLCALFGPNGSGKTTLLRCLAGFLKYNKGNIKINGRDVKKTSPVELAKLVSYVPQEHKPPFPFKVKEVALMGRTPHLGGFFGPSRKDLEYTEYAMNAIGISNIADRYYTQLSGGQRQLVLLSRAFAQDTPIMLFDEPTSALDFKNQMKIWKILKSFAKSGKTVIACTHDPNHVSWFCDYVVVLNDGHVIEKGYAKEVMTSNVLNLLYGDICTVGSYSGMGVVLPKMESP